MIKQWLVVVLAAGLITITAPLAAAQDNPANNQQTPPPENGRRHHGMPDPAERTRELTKRLNLSSEQQTKVQDILQTAHKQMESLRQDNSLSEQDRHAKMMEIRKGSDTQIRALLDGKQQKKFDEMQAEHERWGEGHRHGGPPEGGEPQGPPPPQ
jgi:Spy/CpxP family protein refolding chaperone